jgi:hypothetical protein
MTKTPSKLAASLVAEKGQAAPAMAVQESTIERKQEITIERNQGAKEMLTPAPLQTTYSQYAPAVRAVKPINDTPLNFKMPDDFVLSFKARAVRDRLKLHELLTLCFEAYCKANP